MIDNKDLIQSQVKSLSNGKFQQWMMLWVWKHKKNAFEGVLTTQFNANNAITNKI